MAKKSTPPSIPSTQEDLPEFQPSFTPAPITSKLNWWPWTSRFVTVLRHKKTGQLQLASFIASHPDILKLKLGSPCNIPDHEVMMVVDLTELLDET